MFSPQSAAHMISNSKRRHSGQPMQVAQTDVRYGPAQFSSVRRGSTHAASSCSCVVSALIGFSQLDCLVGSVRSFQLRFSLL
ncbi:hypothetical protein SDJN03_08623, partial [Cucurbita argyrosperma subsp. sororia]